MPTTQKPFLSAQNLRKAGFVPPMPVAVRPLGQGRQAAKTPSAPVPAPSGLTAADVYKTALALINQPQYDPSQEMSQLPGLDKTAASGPTAQDLQASLLRAKQGSLQQGNAALDSIPLPQQEMLSEPNTPPLNLPNEPQPVQAQMDPMAGIAAALAGFVSPRDAGQFGASAIQGSLRARQIRQQEQEQRYEHEFQRVQVKHADDLNRDNIRRRVEEINGDRRYNNTVADVRRQMEKAQRTAEQAELGGVAGAYEKYSADSKPARDAGVTAAQIREGIATKQAGAKANQDRGDKMLNAAIGLGKSEDANDLRRTLQQMRDEQAAERADRQQDRLDARQDHTQDRIDARQGASFQHSDAAAAKRAAGGGKGKGKTDTSAIQQSKSTFVAKKTEYKDAVKRWKDYSALIDKKKLDGKDKAVHQTWDALRQDVDRAAKEYQAADRDYRGAVKPSTAPAGNLPAGMSNLRIGK